MSISKLRERLDVPPPPEPAAPSLPPAPGETCSPASVAPPASPKPKTYSMPPNGIMRKKALAIVALRANGLSTEEIAKELNICVQNVWAYVYRATKAGYLTNKKSGESLLWDPKDRLKYELSHKIVRNFAGALDDQPVVLPDGEIKHVNKRMRDTAMQLAEGTLFKEFDPAPAAAPSGMNVLAVRIDMPNSGNMQVREGTIGGVPAYSEGEIAKDGQEV